MRPRHPYSSLNLRQRLSRWSASFSKATIRFAPRIRLASDVLDVLALIAAFVCFGCFASHLGFNHTADEYRAIFRIMRYVQGIFIANILFNIIFDFRRVRRETRALKWIIDIAVLTSLLPWIYPHPAHPWIPWLERVLYSTIYLYSVLGVYAAFEISLWIMKCMNRRTNPALLLSGSFLVFIIVGTGLLMLPKCTYTPISFVDTLFVSTSAVCITGLTPVDVSVTFTPLGELILGMLIQIGGLGVLTFTSFFALFYTGGTSIYSQLMVKDLIYTRSFNELLPTMLYILGITLLIEGIGAVLIYFSIQGIFPMTTQEEIGFAVFHSISAFCNAGFSTVHGGMSNPMLLYGNQWIYLAMSLIITAGSIGFPILVNCREYIGHKMRRLLRHSHDKVVHIWSMNTKIVLITSASLMVSGVVLFYLWERDNTLAGMSPWMQAVQSIFNATVPRSAGFASVSPAAFMPYTLIFVMFLMWIGGASQSTAGGIKVNTFGAMLLNIRTVMTGKHRVTAFHRTISVQSMQRVHTVIAVSVISVMVYSVAILMLEPQLSTRNCLFEVVSAVFTVGSSLGCTPDLSDASKIILCTAMFFGRIGMLSILMGFADSHRSNSFRYPSDSIIIN